MTVSISSNEPHLLLFPVPGGLYAAVPGELRGYQALLDHVGSNMTWAALFQDAIRLARYGFVVHPHLADALRNKRDDVYRLKNMR